MAKAIINGNEIFGNVHMGEGGDVANPNIADVYDPTQTYNAGDRRIYNDVLYVCNDDNVTGAWDSTKWDSATIDEIISALTADDISYSAGVSVADKLSEIKVDELTFNTAINTTMGAFYRSAFITVDISSYGFTNPPKIFMQPLSENAYPIGVLVLAQSITATSFQFAFVAGQSSTAEDVETFIFMHGN